MGVRRISLLVALTAVVLGSAATVAHGVLLDKGTDKGGTPLAYASGRAENGTKLIAKVTSKPKAQVNLDYDTNCVKDFKNKVRAAFVTKKTPFKLRLKKGFKGFDDCLVQALVSYEDNLQNGTLRVELIGR